MFSIEVQMMIASRIVDDEHPAVAFNRISDQMTIWNTLLNDQIRLLEMMVDNDFRFVALIHGRCYCQLLMSRRNLEAYNQQNAQDGETYRLVVSENDINNRLCMQGDDIMKMITQFIY